MAEDFNRLRLTARQIIRTEFKHGWQFRVEITSGHSADPPSDFDFYVKDITYDPIGIETETERIGGHNFVWPISTQVVTFTMTVRDHSDQRIRKWFEGLTDIIVNKDGTIQLIKKIEVELSRYALNADGSENGSPEILWVIPTKLGEVTESREEAGNIEYPITFMQHRTIANP